MSLLERLNRKKKQYGTIETKKNLKIRAFKSTEETTHEGAYQAFKTKIHTQIVNEMPEELQYVINQPDSDRKELYNVIERISN